MTAKPYQDTLQPVPASSAQLDAQRRRAKRRHAIQRAGIYLLAVLLAIWILLPSQRLMASVVRSTVPS